MGKKFNEPEEINSWFKKITYYLRGGQFLGQKLCPTEPDRVCTDGKTDGQKHEIYPTKKSKYT